MNDTTKLVLKILFELVNVSQIDSVRKNQLLNKIDEALEPKEQESNTEKKIEKALTRKEAKKK